MNYKKASFWKRLVGCLIDTVLLTIVSGVIQAVFGLSDILEYWIYFLIFFAYNMLMDHYFQATLGKMILKLKVIKTDGTTPDILSSFYRNFGKNISILPLGYGYFRILAPHQRQTIHDQLANCLVIDTGNKNSEIK